MLVFLGFCWIYNPLSTRRFGSAWLEGLKNISGSVLFRWHVSPCLCKIMVMLSSLLLWLSRLHNVTTVFLDSYLNFNFNKTISQISVRFAISVESWTDPIMVIFSFGKLIWTILAFLHWLTVWHKLSLDNLTPIYPNVFKATTMQTGDRG